jgi:hypothetical protein
MLRNYDIASACSGSVKGGWTFREIISTERVSSGTLQDCLQLLLTHVPYFLHEASGLKAAITNLTRFWLRCMFRLPKLISENQLYETISINSKVWRERILTAHIQKRILRRAQLSVKVEEAGNPQAMNPSITIYHLVQLDFRNWQHSISIPELTVTWHRTMCSYHCSILLWTPTLIEVAIVAERLTMNLWCNSVQLTTYLEHNQNVSEYSWPICQQLLHHQVLESIRLPLNPSSLTILSLCPYLSFVYHIL